MVIDVVDCTESQILDIRTMENEGLPKVTNKEIDIKLDELNQKYPYYNNNKRNFKNARTINEEASTLIDKCQMKQLENFDGVVYNIGRKGDACIHSEPKFDKPRLFLGLVLNEI